MLIISAISACVQAAVLKYAGLRWEKNRTAVLSREELMTQLPRIREEVGHLSVALRGTMGQPSSAEGQSNGNAQAIPDSAQAKQASLANTPVIAPRLRIEDLKPPPAKRQKQNPKVKDEKPSSASGSPVKVKAEGESNGNVTSPPSQTKRPQPKRRRKPTNAGMPQEPIDVDAAGSTPVDLTASPDKVDNGPAPAVPARPPILTAAPDNVLGVKLGEQMVQARIKADNDAQSDPVTYLTSQWKRLENVLGRHDQTVLDNVKADLAIDVPVPFDDALGAFTVRMRTAQAPFGPSSMMPHKSGPAMPMPIQQPAVPEGFDYSSFIDFSGLEEDEESAPTIIAATPDLLGPGDARFEVSPSSEGATGTPRQAPPPIRHHRAPIGTVSPVQQHVDLFGEDGWLTEGLADSKWDEGFDPNASYWHLGSI
jgi:hypothetical protein